MARILLLTQTYVPDPCSTGQYFHDAAKALRDRGHEILVLTSNRGYDDPGQRYPSEETQGLLKVRRMPCCSFGKGSLFARVAGMLSFLVQATVRGLLSRKPDVILVSTSPPACQVVALVLSWLRGCPFCYWIHDIYPDQAVQLGILENGSLPVRMMNLLNLWAHAHAKRIVVLDRFMYERVQRKLDVSAKIAIVPPWSPSDDCEPIEHADNPWRKEHLGEDGRRIVMYSGNHTSSNPLDTLLQAAWRLRDEEGLEFVFVGGGVDKKRIDALAEQEHFRNIRSLPYQPLETLHYSLPAADVHVVSMGHELVGISHPCKIYGAMAAARPVLLFGPEPCHVTDIFGRHEIGWRVDHGDVDRTVEVLRDILRAPCERLEEMGRTAHDLIRRRYRRDALIDSLCDEVEAALELPTPHKAPTAFTTHPPSVSVIIPARNAEATIATTLDSVLSQDYEGSVEIIVADGSDTPATSEVVRRMYPMVRLFSNPERTIGSGFNAALRMATGEIVVRCDTRTTLGRRYLRRAVETLKRTGAANVGGRQLPEGKSFFERAVSMAMSLWLGTGGARYRLGGDPGPVDTVYLGVFRRETLNMMDGYDPTLERNEDYELNWRLRQRGETVWFDPELDVAYLPRSRLRDLSRQYFDFGRWKRLMLKRNPASLKLRQIFAPAFTLAGTIVSVLALTGIRWPALMILGAYLLALAGAAVVMGVRRWDVAAAFVPLALVTMHLAWGIGFLSFRPRAAGPRGRRRQAAAARTARESAGLNTDDPEPSRGHDGRPMPEDRGTAGRTIRE